MGDEHRVLPGRRSHRQQALHSACQVLVVGVGEGLIQEVPCHAHDPDQRRARRSPGSVRTGRPAPCPPDPKAADRTAELAGLLASVVGEVSLGPRVGQVGPGVVLGRLGCRVADENDVSALAQTSDEVAAARLLGECGRDAGPGRSTRAGPVSAASGDGGEQEARNQRDGPAGGGAPWPCPASHAVSRQDAWTEIVMPPVCADFGTRTRPALAFARGRRHGWRCTEPP